MLVSYLLKVGQLGYLAANPANTSAYWLYWLRIS